MKPIDAKTFDQICELEFDNIDTANDCALLLSDDEVSIYPPNNSAPYVSIPREDFEETQIREDRDRSQYVFNR